MHSENQPSLTNCATWSKTFQNRASFSQFVSVSDLDSHPAGNPLRASSRGRWDPTQNPAPPVALCTLASGSHWVRSSFVPSIQAQTSGATGAQHSTAGTVQTRTAWNLQHPQLQRKVFELGTAVPLTSGSSSCSQLEFARLVKPNQTHASSLPWPNMGRGREVGVPEGPAGNFWAPNLAGIIGMDASLFFNTSGEQRLLAEPKMNSPFSALQQTSREGTPSMNHPCHMSQKDFSGTSVALPLGVHASYNAANSL